MTTDNLLPARRPGHATYRIAVVCLGNICRSPMADVVLNSYLQAAGLRDAVEVVSAGTGDWHMGNPMDRRAAATLTEHGYDASQHRAQQITGKQMQEYDLVLAMDQSNQADLRLRAPGFERVALFRSFDPAATDDDDRTVPDPYYGNDDGFEKVLVMVERTATGIVAALSRMVDAERRG